MSLATTDSLMQASSSSFSTRFFSAVRAADQVDAVAGQIPQPADRRRRHEAGPQHLPLGDLAQPHRVQLVGLRPAGQVLDVAGVDQPRLEPVRLQQVEHRLPVVRRRLHHHPGHAQLDQPVGQPQQRPGHRRIRRHLLQPPSRPPSCGHPHTAHQLGLADIQRRDPLDDLLSSATPANTPHLLATPSRPAGGRPQEPQQGQANLIRVLEANNEGPTHGSQRPTRFTASNDHRATTSQGDHHPIFSPERASRRDTGASTATPSRSSPTAACRCGCS